MRKELSMLRTGRATPIILDSVMVDSYGSLTQVKYLATISIEDAKTLRVTPYDKSQMKGLEVAIGSANLGISTSPQGESLRVIFPELSTERRILLIKLAKEKLENTRVSVRQARDEARAEIQTRERNGELSEDEKFRKQEELQKLVDNTNSVLEELVKKKEKEILE